MSKRISKLLLPSVVLLAATNARPHGAGVGGSHVMDWHSQTVSRVVSTASSWNNLGATVAVSTAGERVAVGNRTCMQAAALDVDVRDSYGFDLNEPVVLTLVVDRQAGSSGIAVMYDRVGGPGRVEPAIDDKGTKRFVELTVPLPNARFANRGDHGTDMMLTAASTPAFLRADSVTVCDIRIARSYKTPVEPYGRLDLTIQDEAGVATAARLGLYGADGRLPIPSPDAVQIRKFDDLTRTFLLQGSAVWPHDNRFVFYVDGRYQARVPAGSYQLVATKGIEYRMLNETIEVRADETTRKIYRLERHVDMPRKGWYSGDVHIHNLRRQEPDSVQLLAQSRAEDVHVANILKMGNVAETYFPQYAWGQSGRDQRGAHTLVPGQEDPRTLTLGHTIHLNIERPVRFADDYLNYHRVFEAVAAQGGISGFAHASGGEWGVVEGMTMQAAFGLLDFGEVMQAGEIGTDAWFSGLEQGRTFVTNGPILDLTLNGHTIGGEVRVGNADRLNVSASAVLNPDIGTLVRLELIKHGEVIARESSQEGAENLTLRFSEDAQESAWYVVRAHGQKLGQAGSITAITAPVYVVVDGEERAWKRQAVPGIAEGLISALEDVKNRALADVIETEAWHTIPVWAEHFSRQLALARERIEMTQQKLRALAEAAGRASE